MARSYARYAAGGSPRTDTPPAPPYGPSRPLAALPARDGQLALDLLEPPREGVALRGRRRELALAQGVALLALRQLRLQLGLARVEPLQLALQPRDALLGRQVAGEERVG